MKVIITEDIVRNALNESIDEFMLEEELMNEINWGGGWKGIKKWWNKSNNGQKVKNGISNVWNGIKDAAAMFMDKETNGQWNRRYGIHAKGNNKVVGSFYLQKWFEPHYNRLYDIVYGSNNGSRIYFYANLRRGAVSFTHDWQNNLYRLSDKDSGKIYELTLNRNGVPYKLDVKNSYGVVIDNGTLKKQQGNSYFFECSNNNNLTIYSGEDNTTPEAYIAKECTPDSFERDTQYTIGDKNFKNIVKQYLQEIQDENNINIKNLKKDPKYIDQINYKALISKFTYKEFYRWWGKNYDSIKKNGDEQNNEQQVKQQKQDGNVQATQVQDNNFTPYENLTPPPDNNQDNYNGYENSPFDNDLGHGAPGSNSIQQQPIPNSNGTFVYNTKSFSPVTNGPYNGWVLSKDANGRRILVNPQDPTKAVFY